jgi:predicted outer membrane repeat protein
MKGNGECDAACNNKDCNFDSGDCGCSEGCDYGEEDCSSACTVLKCNYSSEVDQCDKAYLRAAGRYYQLLQNDFAVRFSLDTCKATSTSCTDEILEKNYEGRVCDSSHCSSLDCAYGLGCSSSLRTCPDNCLQCTSDDGCLKCASGYFNYATTCVQDCPTDYSTETVDGDDLCVESEYATQKLIVDPSSTDTSVYTTLYNAMYQVDKEKAVIYLVKGDHILEVDTSITITEEKQFNPLKQTATKKSFKLTTAYCSEVAVANCVADSSKASVIVREPKMEIISYFNAFEISHVIFDGASALDGSCTEYYCQYCPYYEHNQDNTYFTDDRNAKIDEALINSNQWKTNCATDYSEVTFVSSGSIKYGSFKIKDCEFNNFRYELASVIRASYIEVDIESTVFSNIVPYDGAVYVDAGSQVSIKDVTVRLLNNGFEYTSTSSQQPFLILVETAAVTIQDSVFSMNLAIKGSDSTEGKFPSALIYAKNFKYTVEITGCSFTNNWTTTALIRLDVTTLTYVETYTNSVQDQLTWKHLVVKDSSFSNNGGSYLVYYSMETWPHNFQFAGLTFSHNYVDKALVYVEKLNQITSYSQNGSMRYLTVNGAKLTVKYTRQTGGFTGITYSSNNSVLGNIYLKSICNVSLASITSTSNGISTASFGSVVITPIVNDPSTYISAVSNIGLSAVCTSSYRFEGGSSLQVTSSSFTNDRCAKGIGGISVSNDLAALTFEQLSFSKVSSGSLVGGVLAVDSCGDTVTIGPSFNIEACLNTKGPSGIGITSTNSTITYKESYCKTSTGAFGTCVALSEVEVMSLTSVQFTDNAATTGNGGAIYFSTGASESSTMKFSVQDCTFTSNKARTLNGGALYLTSTGSTPGLSFVMSSTVFTLNYSKRQGSAVYISSSMDLKSDSVISSCSFTNNSADKDAALMVLYASGKLTVRNTPFKGNSGASSVSSIYALFGSDNVGFEINSCELTGNTGTNVILALSNGEGNSLITNAVNIHDNFAVGLTVDTLIWTESSSIFQKNTGGGVQITVTDATLTGTKFLFNKSSSSGAAARVNNGSTFSCDKCEFTSNVSLNNGGAVMSESESVVAISNSSITNNSAVGSGSAMYIISSTSSSTLKSVTIVNNSTSNTGGIALLNTKLVVEDCTISANTAPVGTPGIYANSSTLTIKTTKFSSQL